MEEKRFIDLHVHSNNSDGTLAPVELINLANLNKVGILSIADHDSIDGLDEFKSNIAPCMLGVNGVEFSSVVNNNNIAEKIHILGYCFNENNSQFLSLVKEMEDIRISSHLEELKKVREMIGNLPEEGISKLNIRRYCWFDRDIIKCLKDSGYDEQVIEDLKAYYKANRFSYGNGYALDAQRVCEAIHASGGYVIFAHPMAYKFSHDKDRVKSIANKLIDIGIDGIEIYQSDCPMEDTIWLKKMVDDSHLFYSVGSDFHKYGASDGRTIGLGVDNNLCITETSLTDEIIRKKKYFKKVV